MLWKLCCLSGTLHACAKRSVSDTQLSKSQLEPRRGLKFRIAYRKLLRCIWARNTQNRMGSQQISLKNTAFRIAALHDTNASKSESGLCFRIGASYATGTKFSSLRLLRETLVTISSETRNTFNRENHVWPIIMQFASTVAALLLQRFKSQAAPRNASG